MSLFAYVPTPAWPLGAGLLLTSGMLFGNIGLGLTGPLPIIREKLGPSTLDEKQKVRVWTLFFDSIAPIVVSSAISSAVLHLTARYLSPFPQVRTACAIATGTSLGVLGFTRVLIIPIVQRIKALDKKSVEDWSADDRKRSMELIEEWNNLHMVRYIPLGIAWAAGLSALLMTFAKHRA